MFYFVIETVVLVNEFTPQVCQKSYRVLFKQHYSVGIYLSYRIFETALRQSLGSSYRLTIS